jgi:hypothetical protein
MVKKVLELWTKLATNVRMRDRSVKIIQYGCQMLIGYYGCKLSEDIMCGLNRTRSTASTARKAFWLLKSINHLNDIYTMLEAKALAPDRPIAVKLDFIEQVFLVFYYLTENLIFLARCKLFGFDEDKLDMWCNIAWFGGDLAFFFSTLARLFENTKERTQALEKVKRIHAEAAESTAQRRDSISSCTTVTTSPSSTSPVTVTGGSTQSDWCSAASVETILDAEKELKDTNARQRELQLSLAIVSTEL